ncbi:MAG: hypothetical protein EOS78_21210, partial [Mesorhizobium sp.]
IFMVCVLVFRRGIVGEVYARVMGQAGKGDPLRIDRTRLVGPRLTQAIIWPKGGSTKPVMGSECGGVEISDASWRIIHGMAHL